jgi:hypothetical protein
MTEVFRKKSKYSQPVNDLVVSEAEYEFVDHAVDAYCATDKFQSCVLGIVEYEMVLVKMCERCPSNSTCHLLKAVCQAVNQRYGLFHQ